MSTSIPHTSALLLALFAPLTAGRLTFTGQTLFLNDIPYYVPATSANTLPSTASLASVHFAGSLVPVTVVTSPNPAGNTSSDSLGSIIEGFEKDDVWNQGFLDAIFVQYTRSTGPQYPTYGNSTLLGSNQSTVISVLPSKSTSSSIPSGPYFASPDGSLYQPLRLYSDIEGAFTQPLIAEGDGTYSALPANIAGIQQPAVGVPSRLYFSKSAEKPLAGVRLGVKDIYDVAGVKTSDGNRAWYGFYPPATKNAVSVQKLIDAGAIIVGKLKTSQFANGETATADWVDYHAPFNPRGDGYQDPSSSSSGPGAAEGSYPWLDLSLGSDTGGSIRGPSQVQGVFGNRPSHDLVPLTGVMPLAPQLDTAGFLTRDPAIWSAAAKVLYGNLPFYNTYPKTLYTLDFPTSADTEADTILLSFLSRIETFLSTNATALNISTLWTSTNPSGAAAASLDDLLNITYPILISKEQTMLVRDPFYAAYAAAHDGRKPFVDPVPLVRWAYGDSQPASTLTDAVSNKTIFQNWWATQVQPNNTATCSDSLLLYSEGSQTVYRNTYLDPPRVPYGFSNSRISPFAEVPDFVIPIGSAAYNSSITLHTEYLPVTVDIMAAKGCDGLIFSLVNDLQAAGIVNVSEAGQTIAGGEILLRM